VIRCERICPGLSAAALVGCADGFVGKDVWDLGMCVFKMGETEMFKC